MHGAVLALLVASSGIGGLTLGKTDAVAIDAQTLRLSPTRVQVEYALVAGKDATATLAFPLPRVDVCAPSASEPCHDEAVLGLKFEVWVDGAKVAPTRSTERILVGDAEVSALLKKHGLTKVQDPAMVFALKPAAKAELQKAGLLGDIDSIAPSMHWQVEKVFTWDLTFKKGQRRTVKLTYPALTSLPTTGDGFCLDPARERMDAQRRPAWIVFPLAGPIRDFTLTLEKADPQQRVSTCFEGLEQKDDKTLVAKKANFMPTADLAVLFF